MKAKFQELEKQRGDFSHSELEVLVTDLYSDISKTNTDFYQISMKRVGYGTYKSFGWANNYYFGDKLAELLEKALTGKTTHNEDQVFSINDFEDEIIDTIYNYLYH